MKKRFDLELDFGDMKQKVDVEQFSTSKDTSGQQIRTWTSVRRVWCRINSMSSIEQSYSQQTVPISISLIKIRYFKGLTTKHRLRWGNRIFNITNISDIQEQKRIMMLDVKEGDVDG